METKRVRGVENTERQTARLMILPAMVVILGLNIYPLLYNFGTSFFWNDLLDKSKQGFAGFQQYIEVFSHPGFLNSIKITAYFAAVSLLVQTTFGTLIALLLNQEFKGRGIVRTIILLPWAIPNIVNANIWSWIFNANYGLLNRLLIQFGITNTEIVWLGTAFSAINMVILADTWRMLPLTVIMMLAAMQTIDKSTVEASIVDGANAFQRFFRIKVPLMKSIILILLITRTTQTLKVFDIIFMMTGGGPGNGTMTISFYTYYEIFKNLDYGGGATLAIAITALIFIISLIYVRIINSRDSL